jgi:hypothetical protein
MPCAGTGRLPRRPAIAESNAGDLIASDDHRTVDVAHQAQLLIIERHDLAMNQVAVDELDVIGTSEGRVN